MGESWIELLREDLERLSNGECEGGRGMLAPGERRDVAVLFIDLAGFTTLSERMDHEEVHRIASGIMRSLSSVVCSHGGVVDKFEGDRLMALFGAETCREDDCSRAAECSLRLLDRLTEISLVMRRHGLSLSGRIGLSFGSVTVAPDPSGHMTATGDEVNVASRLEQVAETGTILVSSRVRDECGDLFEWVDLGEVGVRGRTKPVRVYRLAGPGSLRTARLESVQRLPEPVMTGRTVELGGFTGWLSSPPDPPLDPRGAPRHRLCIVSGEPGTGKTRLLREMASAVMQARPGTGTLEGRVTPYGTRPFDYWTSMLRAFAGGAGQAREELSARLEELFSGSAEPGQETVSLLTDLVHGSAPDRDSRPRPLPQIRRALRDFVAAFALKAPGVLMVLDDSQWLDPSSMEVLEFVLANCETPEPLYVLLAGRSDHSNPPVEPKVHRNYADIHRIELGAMSPLEICAVAASMLGYASGRDLPRELSSFLIRRTGGNPRFAREILLDLIEGGSLQDTAGEWNMKALPDDLHIPGSLTRTVRSRVDRLPARLRMALQIAAVIGSEFSVSCYLETARRLGQEDPGSDLESLASLGILEMTTAQGRRMVKETDELAVRAAYDGLLHQNRMLIHRCVADALLSSSNLAMGESGMIARHLHMSGDKDRAVGWAVRAALEASSTSQARDMSRWALQALEWMRDWPESEERTSYTLDSMKLIREAFGSIGSFEGLEGAIRGEIELCRSLGDQPREAEALLALGNMLVNAGRLKDGDEAYGEAAEIASAIGRPGLLVAVKVAEAILRMRTGRHAEARSLLEEAIPLAGEGSPRETIVKIRYNLATVFMVTGDLDEAARRFEELETMLGGEGDPDLLAFVLVNHGILRGMRGDLETAAGKLESALRMKRLTGDRNEEASILNNLGKCRHEMGDTETGRRLVRQALLLYRETGNPRGEAASLVNMGTFSMLGGDFDRASFYFAEALRINKAIGHPMGELVCLVHAGLVGIETGSASSAHRAYRQIVDLIERMGLRPAAVPPEFGHLRERLVQKGMPDAELPLPAGWPAG